MRTCLTLRKQLIRNRKLLRACSTGAAPMVTTADISTGTAADAASAGDTTSLAARMVKSSTDLDDYIMPVSTLFASTSFASKQKLL